MPISAHLAQPPRPIRTSYTVAFLGFLAAIWPAMVMADVPWSIQLLYGDAELFPSALVCTTDAAIFPPRLAIQVGDGKGVISALMVAPRDHCEVTVTIAATAISDTSSITVTLPTKGHPYRIAPYLVLNHTKLLQLRYPIPGEALTVTRVLDGQRETKTLRVRIHALNDCLSEARIGGRWLDTSYLAAGFVNENNPTLPATVMRAALAKGYVSSFAGYAADQAGVAQQVEAIYRALQDLGFNYTSAIQSSVVSRRTRSQWVKQVSDSMGAEQANCLDGSVLFASILTKLKLRAVVFIVPARHAFVGVYTTARGSEKDGFMVFEATEIGKPFAKARADGQRDLDNARKVTAWSGLLAALHLTTPISEFTLADVDAEKVVSLRPAEIQDPDFYKIDIRQARAHGIMPIPEVLSSN